MSESIKKCIKKIYIDNLKGLSDITINFDDHLTAIMGINGIGKSTIIHALACVYQPVKDECGENHRFPEFFVPNTDALWNGSRFSIFYTEPAINRREKLFLNNYIKTRQYGKRSNRWTPKYSNRPCRNVYYLGISTCVPDIESIKTISKISYSSKEKDDDLSKKICNYAAFVLHKDYDSLYDNSFYKKNFKGVKTKAGTKYSSLSMGSGEQRVMKILETIVRAEKNSLILIDEIDLLLHVSSIRKLIEVIYRISIEKKLQIIFTSHSMEMLNLIDKVKIQYLLKPLSEDKIFVLDRVTDDIIYDLTEEKTQKYTVYVEDDFAQALVECILREHSIKSETRIVRFGAIDNAFYLAAAKVIDNCDENICIVLDGDKHVTDDDKEKIMKKVFSGSEVDAENRRKRAIQLLHQFNLPDNTAPEVFLHKMIIKYCHDDTELFDYANIVKNNIESHSFIKDICQKMGCSVSDLIRDVYYQCKETDEWREYVNGIDEWIRMVTSK